MNKVDELMALIPAWSNYDELRAVIDAALTEAREEGVLEGATIRGFLDKSAPDAQPVAWHVCSVNSDGSLSLEYAAPWEETAHEHINDAINEHDIDGAESWVVRPVYATPQPQQTEPSQDIPPQRNPLTDEQVRDALDEGYFWATSRKFILRVARAIERAHGIGEQE